MINAYPLQWPAAAAIYLERLQFGRVTDDLAHAERMLNGVTK